MLKDFLALRAGPDLAVRLIDIKLLFKRTPREEIEVGSVLRTVTGIQTCERTASLEVHLAENF